ncbi:hypothetical protein [Paralcaligenes ureilyticus]|uniref:hypothetical protein n=1 Tax=Paralcaligenes ureilyticus TaxID=627131 RepID=UPI0010464C6D|nr:hypothetical protein [Paralcaligenes ureilyticus]
MPVIDARHDPAINRFGTHKGCRYKNSVRIRVTGNPIVNKTFLDKRSAHTWAIQTEDAIKRGVFEFGKQDAPTLRKALSTYLKKITPTMVNGRR